MSTSLISWHPLRNQLLENCDQCVADEGKSISVPNVTPSLANRSGPNEMTGKRWIAGADTTDRQGRLSLQNGHHGSKAFKGSLTLFTFIADVATGPVRCPPSATQNFADAKFRRASSDHRHCPRFYSPFSCVQGQRVGATGAGQGRCPRP